MNPGEIYRHDTFYSDAISGQLLPKYLVILAVPAGGDITARLLTSRYSDVRPKDPPCYHGDPYPGFYLGVLGGALQQESWIDLRSLPDLDIDFFRRDIRLGQLSMTTTLTSLLLHAALECAAGADDTTRQQERIIRDTLATLR